MHSMTEDQFVKYVGSLLGFFNVPEDVAHLIRAGYRGNLSVNRAYDHLREYLKTHHGGMYHP